MDRKIITNSKITEYFFLVLQFLGVIQSKPIIVVGIPRPVRVGVTGLVSIRWTSLEWSKFYFCVYLKYTHMSCVYVECA